MVQYLLTNSYTGGIHMHTLHTAAHLTLTITLYY